MASLNVLEAEKTLYEANAKKAAADLKAAIEARATDVLQDALVNEKIVKLKELLIQETASMKTSGTAYLAIKQAVQDVELKANALKTTLSESLGALDTLVTDCNKLFTGLGASNEYLLDICTQTSNACVDVDMGRHVGSHCHHRWHQRHQVLQRCDWGHSNSSTSLGDGSVQRLWRSLQKLQAQSGRSTCKGAVAGTGRAHQSAPDHHGQEISGPIRLPLP